MKKVFCRLYANNNAQNGSKIKIIYRYSVRYLKVFLVGTLAIGVIAGCNGIGAGTVNAKQFNLQSQVVPTAGDRAAAYYYFTSAQIKLKEGYVAEAQWMLEKAMKSDSESAVLKLEAAGLHLLQKNSEMALVMIQDVLRDQPHHTEALIMAGRAYQQMDALPESKLYYERALDSAPSEPEIYLYLGRLYWSENDLINAERVFRQMANQFPDSYAAHYFSGKVWLIQGKTSEAEGAFLRSLKLEPSLEESRLELIRIYKSQKLVHQIAEMYESILEYHPDNVEAAIELAVIYRQSGKSEMSAPLLAEVGRHSEHDNGVLSYVFDNYLEPKDYELGAWMVLGMLKGAPQSADLHYLAGVAFDGLKMVPLALDYLRRVPHGSQFYKNAVVYSALMLRDSGRIDQSIQVIRDALANDPQQADYYLYLGSFYEALENYEKAIDILLQGVAVDNGNIRLHFRIGIIQDKAGRKQDAINAMKNVLELQPEDPEALNYLGYTYADLGIHLDEAEDLIQSALRMKPNDGYITDSLAWVYYKQGRYEEALDWLIKAENLVPNDPVILEHLGDVHLKLKQHEKALKYYQRSIELNDKDREQIEYKIRLIKNDSPPNQ